MGCASSGELEIIRRHAIDDTLQSGLKDKPPCTKVQLGTVSVLISQDSSRNSQSICCSVSRSSRRAKTSKVAASPSSTQSLSREGSRNNTAPAIRNTTGCTTPQHSQSTTFEFDAWTSAGKALEKAEAMEMKNSVERANDLAAYLAAGGNVGNKMESINAKRNAGLCSLLLE